MANLIITVISIALVAVAALSAAYYGGSAFMAGQAKARNNTIINLIKQADVAYNLCIAQEPNGRSDEGPCENNNNGSGSLITKGYMSVDVMDKICADGEFMCEEGGYGYNTGKQFLRGSPGFYVTLFGTDSGASEKQAKNNVELCNAVTKANGEAQAQQAVLSSPIFPFDYSGILRKMGCTYRDDDGNYDIPNVFGDIYIYSKF